jgi:hypothetical protein
MQGAEDCRVKLSGEVVIDVGVFVRLGEVKRACRATSLCEMAILSRKTRGHVPKDILIRTLL